MPEGLMPFLKWAGGKYRLKDDIVPLLGRVERYIEPFLGAGAIALNIECNRMVLCDTNFDLILVWLMLEKYGDTFIRDCQVVYEAGNMDELYYELRSEFNTTFDPYRKAVLFVYLNRHGFRGLCRYNRQGLFNVPFGWYPSVQLPVEDMQKARERLVNCEIRAEDFRATLAEAGEGDTVYCDPPYLPISKSSCFTGYSSHGFTLEDHQDLVQCARAAVSRGATVAISNNITDATESLYPDAQVYRLSARRVIGNGKPGSGRKLEELCAVYRP